MPKSAVRHRDDARYPRASMPSALARTFVVGSLALVAGCDAFNSFETACEERLPAAKIEVVADPVTYATDLSRSSAELAAKSTHSGSRTLMGLVTADLKSAVSLGGSGIANRDRSRFCMRPAVKVNLAFNPMTLHIARELPEGSCGYRITLEHEQKHIHVYRQYLGDISREIEESLRAELGRKVLYFRAEAEGDAHVEKVLQERIGPYVENAMLQVVHLQRQVDSREEYARLDRAQAECEARSASADSAAMR
jgi:hypothetical protein